MIGVSLSKCVADIVDGKVALDQVEVIYAGTSAKNERDWDTLIARYIQIGCWGDGEKACDVVKRLRHCNQIVQPRLWENPRRHTCDPHWIEDRDDIKWITTNDTDQVMEQSWLVDLGAVRSELVEAVTHIALACKEFEKFRLSKVINPLYKAIRDLISFSDEVAKQTNTDWSMLEMSKDKPIPPVEEWIKNPPMAEDIEAAGLANQLDCQIRGKCHDLAETDAAADTSLFVRGFYRGVAWQKYKDKYR